MTKMFKNRLMTNAETLVVFYLFLPLICDFYFLHTQMIQQIEVAKMIGVAHIDNLLQGTFSSSFYFVLLILIRIYTYTHG